MLVSLVDDTVVAVVADMLLLVDASSTYAGMVASRRFRHTTC